MAFASKFADTRNIPIAQTAIASKMMAVGVDADPVENYDDETKTRTEKLNDKGEHQWNIRVFAKPLAGDTETLADIINVKVWSKVRPVIKEDAPIIFTEFAMRPWASNKGGRLKSGLSFSASGFKQEWIWVFRWSQERFSFLSTCTPKSSTTLIPMKSHGRRQ